MLWAPYNEFSLVIDSQTGVRPASPYGTTVTPGNNTYGSYVSLLAGASLTSDAYGILINVNGIGSNTNATDTLATIGLDPAGGTSFTDFITDLIVSCAAPYTLQGVEYYFPVFIKAGTSIGMKQTQNNASPLAGKAFVRLFCQPSRPDAVRVGSIVRTYGSAPASSSGTAITPGTTSDGAYTQVGTIAAGDAPWFWQVGMGFNNTAFSAAEMYHVDLAIGQTGAKKTPILDHRVFANANEQISMMVPRDGYAVGAPGELVYVRAQVSSTLQTGVSAVAYGVI